MITFTREEAQQVLEALKTLHAKLSERESGLELNKVLIGAIWDSSEIVALPQREWQGLTDEEREKAIGWSVEHIEAKLREKNT